jgi:single-strand DNA-binding protein
MDTYVTMQGNLTADPVSRTTAAGAMVINFRIASSGRRFDRAAGEFRDGDTVYMSVCAWRTLAANAMATLRKGDSVIVQGRLTYRTYDDKAGIRRSVHEIEAIAIGPDLARFAANLRRPHRPADNPVDTPDAATPAVDRDTGEIHTAPSVPSDLPAPSPVAA